MTFLQLHPLRVEQLAEVVELDRLCFGGLWTLEGYQRELDSPNSDLLVLSLPDALPDRPSVVGLACLWAILEEAHITLIAVHPDYRHQGLGQFLLFSLLQSARKRGLEWATLEVRASNEKAIALYQKFNFQEVGRRRKYYQDNGEDAILLWCKGLQTPEFAEQLNQWECQIRDRLKVPIEILDQLPL